MRFWKSFTTMMSAAAALVASPLAAQEAIVLAGSVITDADSAPSGPQIITIADGRIIRLDPATAENTEAARERAGVEDIAFVDLSDKTVLPGLIDLHVHLTGDPDGSFWKEAVEPDEWGVVVGAKNARLTALAGFTTVRDLGSAPETGFSLRRGTAEGMIPGPRIIAAGPALAIIGGHGDTNGFRPEVNELLDTGFTCTGAVECAAKVRLASQNGADIIKITATGGVLSQQGRGLEAHFTDEEMHAIVDTAESLGLHVAAHAHGARGIEAAARAGVHTIEHGTYIDDAAARVMRENDTTLVPTLMAFEGIKVNLGTGFYTPVVEAKINAVAEYASTIVQRARRNGVRIAFGTDAGVFPHGQNAGEFRLLVAGGLTDREALASATTVAAEILGMESEIGRITPGFSADIIAVDGNPLEDATVLENVDWVMVRGRVIE